MQETNFYQQIKNRNTQRQSTATNSNKNSLQMPQCQRCYQQTNQLTVNKMCLKCDQVLNPPQLQKNNSIEELLQKKKQLSNKYSNVEFKQNQENKPNSNNSNKSSNQQINNINLRNQQNKKQDSINAMNEKLRQHRKKKNPIVPIDRKMESTINQKRLLTLKENNNIGYEQYQGKLSFINCVIIIMASIAAILIFLQATIFSFKPVYYCNSILSSTDNKYLEICIQCPQNANCNDGYFTCQVGYQRNKNQCIQKQIYKEKADEVMIEQVNELQSQYGEQLCENPNNQIKPYKDLDQLLKQIRDDLIEQKITKDLDLYLDNLIKFVKQEENQKKYGFSIKEQINSLKNKHLQILIFPTIYTQSLKCAVQNWVINNPLQFLGFISAYILIILILFKIHQIRKYKKISKEIYQFLDQKLQQSEDGEIYISQFDGHFNTKYGSYYNEQILDLISKIREKNNKILMYNDGDDIVWALNVE